MLGDWARVPRMTKKAAIVIAAVALLFGAAGSLFGAPQAGLAALKRQYWRPATIPYPAENPYGRAKEELGRALFFDPILSGARVRSCASCHNPGLSWGDGEPRAIGENQVRLPLRSPTLLNIAWVPKLGWDGHYVIDLYDRGGIDRPSRDNDIRPLHLQSREKADLIAFLNTLGDTPKPYPLPNLPR